MTRHVITAEIEVKFQLSGMPADDREVAYPKVDVEFTFTPGTKPTFDDPGSGAELELVKATLVDGNGLAPTDDQVTDWASAWLDDAGYDAACRAAEREQGPDPDDARDRAIEDKMLERS